MPESLRDEIASAFDEVIPAETPTPEAPAETAPVETKTDDRPRDDSGRFVAKESATGAPAKATNAQGDQSKAPPQQATPPAAEPSKPRYQRPSTWRKETWGVWDKLNANQPLTPEEIHLMAEEAIKRDADFANGVSTYKREWESARPLIEAMSPFMPILQQYNVQPAQWITNLGNAHRMLALGSPQEKAARFVQLAQEYGVPLESLYTLGQDGRLYVNPNLQHQAIAAQQQQAPQQDIESLIEQKLTDRWAQEQLNAFASQTDKHPHYEEVRQTMLGLLQAGLADDLEGAYEAALRHPTHFHLYEARAEQQRKADEAAKAAERAKQAETARRKAVSVRSSTPTSVSAAEGKKGLRSTIEDAFDSTVAGRV